jgi:hypothetical protein
LLRATERRERLGMTGQLDMATAIIIIEADAEMRPHVPADFL